MTMKATNPQPLPPLELRDQVALLQKHRAEKWSAAAIRLHKAIRKLGAVKDGKTLFEHSPTKDDATLTAWQELNDAQAEVAALIAAEKNAEGKEP